MHKAGLLRARSSDTHFSKDRLRQQLALEVATRGGHVESEIPVKARAVAERGSVLRLDEDAEQIGRELERRRRNPALQQNCVQQDLGGPTCTRAQSTQHRPGEEL